MGGSSWLGGGGQKGATKGEEVGSMGRGGRLSREGSVDLLVFDSRATGRPLQF